MLIASRMSHTSLVTRSRQVAYLAAIATVMLTAKVLIGGEFDTIPGGALAVSIMGGTLAAAPYVIARAIEEHLAEQTGSRESVT